MQISTRLELSSDSMSKNHTNWSYKSSDSPWRKSFACFFSYLRYIHIKKNRFFSFFLMNIKSQLQGGGGWVGAYNGNKMFWHLTNLGHYILLRSRPWAGNLRSLEPWGPVCTTGSRLSLTEELEGFKWNRVCQKSGRLFYYSRLETNKASLLTVCKGAFRGQWLIHRKLVHQWQNQQRECKFFKWWGQGRWHTVQTGIGGGATKTGFFSQAISNLSDCGFEN